MLIIAKVSKPIFHPLSWNFLVPALSSMVFSRSPWKSPPITSAVGSTKWPPPYPKFTKIFDPFLELERQVCPPPCDSPIFLIFYSRDMNLAKVYLSKPETQNLKFVLSILQLWQFPSYFVNSRNQYSKTQSTNIFSIDSQFWNGEDGFLENHVELLYIPPPDLSIQPQNKLISFWFVETNPFLFSFPIWLIFCLRRVFGQLIILLYFKMEKTLLVLFISSILGNLIYASYPHVCSILLSVTNIL